jgi:hypothetical protein
MLFETESKARNFIKFNGDDVYNKGELRPYFCPSCGGYHISSKEHKQSYDTATDRLIDAYRKMKNMPGLDEIAMTSECYNMLVELGFKNRRAINHELRSDKFIRFPGQIKEKAKLRYYKDFNL